MEEKGPHFVHTQSTGTRDKGRSSNTYIFIYKYIWAHGVLKCFSYDKEHNRLVEWTKALFNNEKSVSNEWTERPNMYRGGRKCINT